MKPKDEVERPPTLTERVFAVSTHPVMLILGSLVSIVLWMPFGFGYYDFPWQQWVAVIALFAFVVAFACSAVVALDRACYPQFSPLQFAILIVPFLIGMHGLFQMLRWWIYVSMKY